MSRARPADAAIAVGTAAFVACACVILALAWMHHRAAGAAEGVLDVSDIAGGAEARVDGDGFPEVDWEYWRAENPDVIGWVTVPGTSIDHPVCQAPAEDPGYYLDHDAHGGWNWYGAAFLDAGCSEGGLLGSANAVVSGHHMDDGSMFAPLASYAQSDWAASHRTILLQTPEAKVRLEVLAADVVDAAAEPKRVRFAGAKDYRDWWRGVVGGAEVVLAGDVQPARVYTFATCSYRTWADERTLVYAVPAEVTDS